MKLTSRGFSMEFEVLAVGAEAVLMKGYFLGIEAVYKVRIPKPYRDHRLDLRLRRERTLTEAKLMVTAKRAGVNVPYILLIEPDAGVIIMEYLKGSLLKNILNTLPDPVMHKILKLVGAMVGRLHGGGIVHGDLTTSNIIIHRDTGEPYLIDFGLAKVSDDIEDRGVDIHLFLRSLESTHYVIKDKAYSYFLEGYGEVVGQEELNKVIDKVREIRLRGRYVEERKRKRY
ncbi:MAG: Kae1-associated kinase Bud32 [Desulfurococcales archaeon]|nr:Kae1-associated kinase Bud32 [Desulfurococcales archaeon]